jgi:peptidoglycan hydrolase CwlO-like protein
MTQRRVSLPIDQLTDRQIHIHLIGLYEKQVTILTSLEHQMADLNQSVADLEVAVDAINVRFADALVGLQSALDAATSSLADMTVDDEAQKAALTQALADAQAASDTISGQVTELNAIGAAPEVPVEPSA